MGSKKFGGCKRFGSLNPGSLNQTNRDKETNKTNKNIEPFLWGWRAMSDLHHT